LQKTLLTVVVEERQESQLPQNDLFTLLLREEGEERLFDQRTMSAAVHYVLSTSEEHLTLFL